MKSYVSILTSDSYLPGILALNMNLKDLKSRYPFYVVCSDKVSIKTYKILEQNNINYKVIPHRSYTIYDEGTKYWENTFNKIDLFNEIEYERLIYLDCDMCILQNLDFLFDRQEDFLIASSLFHFSDASRQVSDYISRISSNVMVFSPSTDIFIKLENYTKRKTFEAFTGDEGIFQYYIADFGITLLPLAFNIGGKDHFENPIVELKNPYIIHFTGGLKPWHLSQEYQNIYEIDAPSHAHYPSPVIRYYSRLIHKAMEAIY